MVKCTCPAFIGPATAKHARLGAICGTVCKYCSSALSREPKLALGKILMCSIINWLVCSLKAVIKAKRALVPPTSATKMGSNWAEAFGLLVLSLLLSDSCLLFYNGVPLLFIL